MHILSFIQLFIQVTGHLAALKPVGCFFVPLTGEKLARVTEP